MKIFCSVFAGLIVGGASVSFLGTVIFLGNYKPSTPQISIDSVPLQNVKVSSDQATADWNFDVSIKNSNEFGFSYKFKGTLYYYFCYEYGSRSTSSEIFVADATGPTLSQSRENQTTFMVRFGGVSVPICNKLKDGGGNSQLSYVSLALTLEADVEPVPKKSLSPIIRWAVRSFYVDCSKLQIGISSDSTTGVATKVYHGKDGDCYSSWNIFFVGWGTGALR